ncbi:hypothetical protein V8C42DRAFT_308998 [Trichoderma barbatum]
MPEAFVRTAEIAKCLLLLPFLAITDLCWEPCTTTVANWTPWRSTPYRLPGISNFRVSHRCSCKSTLWAILVCHESLGEASKSSAAHATCNAISHNYRASRTANSTCTGHRRAGAAHQERASRPRNRKLARQYGIKSPHDTTFSDTVALRRRVF